MTADLTSHTDQSCPPRADGGADSDAADHVAEARQRARQVLAGESHIGAVDDWRRALVSARDALIFIWLAWVALHGFGDPPYSPYLLVALAFGIALIFAISMARSTFAQVQYYAAEMDRERNEIRDNLEHELDEVRELYAAKGFTEPLLSEIVRTLSADDDRLLKEMMEEELGLSMFHVNHPLLVGVWNFSGALAGGLGLVLPLVWISPEAAHIWMPAGGAALLGVVSFISARATQRGMLEFFTVSLIMAGVTSGVVYLLARGFALHAIPAPTG